MRRLPELTFSLLLAATLHLDWHLARPLHHRLSLELPYHWAITAAVFGIAGWTIARFWTESRWQLGAIAFVAAVLLAQGVEPFFEVLLYQRRVGFDVEPLRWAAFGRAIMASIPMYWGAIWLCAPGARRVHAGA